MHEQAGAVSVSEAVNILFLQLLECYSLVLVTLDPVRAVKAMHGLQEITLFQKYFIISLSPTKPH